MADSSLALLEHKTLQSLSACMASLWRAVICAQEHGHVILGSDLNAKVGTFVYPVAFHHLGNFANPERASRLTSSSESFLKGLGLTHGGLSCWASCAACCCCLMTACISRFSVFILLMRVAHCRVPTGLVVLRHVDQAVHAANDLVPPALHPWLFSQFPENNCRGDTLLEAAYLPQEGQMDISHRFHVRQY